MELTFSELSDIIEEGVWEVRNAPGLDGKALAAERLLGQARGLGSHTGRYARAAWCLDMLCSFFMTLFLYGALLPEGAMPDLLEAVFGLLKINDAADHLRFFLVLLALPIAFDLILSAICKRTLVTVGQTGLRSGANAMQRLRNALYEAQGELNPTNYLPAWTVYLVGGVFMACAAMLLYSTVAARRTRKILTILAAVLLFLLIFGFFVVVLWLKLFLLSVCFSSGDSKSELKELIDEELPDYEEAFQTAEEARQAEQAEQQRLADLKEGAELYRKATSESTVNKVLLARAAEKGDPRANLEIGKKLVENVEGLGRREVAARYADAKNHFRIADEADLPDGILMYAMARLMTEAHDTMGWLNILRRLRTVDRIQVSVKLRTFYTNVRDQLIERVQTAMAHTESEE